MAQLTIEQINKELKYLEYAYNRLLIKTIPYREERIRLEKEKAKLLVMSDVAYAKIEQKKKPLKKSTLDSKIIKKGAMGIQDTGRVVVGEDNDEYVADL
jgi:hypothetical protein